MVEDLRHAATAGSDAGPAAPLASKTVQDVEMLRALADPTRLAILSTLMAQRDDLPVLSVKEIAARLGEPQTKLYRHVKQLEAAGLIRVAATRMVSGILEQRYQASQRDLLFDGKFLRAHADDSGAAVTAMIDGFMAGWLAAFGDERLSPEKVQEAERYRVPTMAYCETRVSPARAAEIKDRLQELMALIDDETYEDPEGVLVDVLMGYYAATEPEPS